MIRPALGGRTIGALGVGYKPLISDWWNPGGSFTCVAAYQAIGAASYAASLVNLANPGTNDAAPGVAPGWNATDGWTFNGSTQYLNTQIVPSDGYTMAVRFSGAPTGLVYVAGCYAGNPRRFHITPDEGATSALWGYGNVQLSGLFGSARTNGVIAITGDGSTTRLWIDGTDNRNQGYTWTAIGYPIWIGGVNSAGSLSGAIAANVQAVAIYSTTLDATQNATLATNMAALI